MTTEPPNDSAADAVRGILSPRAPLTDALRAEWFSLPFRVSDWPNVIVCHGCGALIPADDDLMQEHWRFHLAVTGNVHR